MKRSLVLLGMLVLFGAVFSAGMESLEVSYKNNDKVAEIWKDDSSKLASVEIKNSMEKREGLNYLTDCGILTCSLYLSVSAESAVGITGAASNLHATYAGTYYKTTEQFEVREPVYEMVEEEYTYEECANTTIEGAGENETMLDCTEVTSKRSVRRIAGYGTRTEEREVWKEEPGKLDSGQVEVRIDFTKDDPSAKVDLFAVVEGTKIKRWAWWDSNWLYKLQVNLTSGVSDTLADYPAHFQIDTATLIGGTKLDSDCGDLRIVNCDENAELPFELTNCNDANTDIYTRITLEPSPTLNCVYVYYGNPGEDDAQDICSVWSNNFTRVYHFEEGSYSGSIFDSSCHANGTYNGTGYIEDGKWGNGVRLATGSGSNFVEFPNTYEWGNGNSSFSIWGMANSSQYLQAKIFSLVSAYTDRTGLGGWSVKLYTQNNIGNSYMADVIVEPVSSGDTTMNGKWNSWTLWSAAQNVSGYGSAMFVNGSLAATQSNGKVNNGYPGVHIGNDYINQDRAWRGLFDEYRESNVTRSGNWTLAESEQGYVVGNEQYPDSTLARTSLAISPSTIYVDTVNATCSASYDSSEDDEFTASMGLAINGTLIGAFNATNNSYQNKDVWNYTFNVEDYTSAGVNFSCWSDANDSETYLEIAYTENKSVANLVPGCMLIDEAGIFELGGDIYGADAVSGVSGISAACVIIGYEGVTLNCSGYSMDANNTADAAGILVNATAASILNCPSVSGYEKGVYFQNVQQGAVENTTVRNSTEGVSLYASSLINITNCTFHNSTKGALLDGATGGSLESNIFFGNEYDFYADNSNYTMLTNYFTPDGSFANYTNLTVEDAGASTDVYMVGWSASPGSSGEGASFGQKFVNISSISGTPSIDELNWSWDSSELACYNEESLSLRFYNSTAWTTLNDTPDMANNVLALYGLEPEGIYGIFDSNVPPVAENATLNTTLGHNTTDENLTLYWDSYDTNGNMIKNITNWFLDYVPIAPLNMPFEGGSYPGYTKDYSNYSNNGTVTGATWSSTGGYDGYGAYHFDGDDYITASDSSLNLAKGYTMSAWFNTSDKARDHFVLSWGSNQAGGRRSMFVQSGTGYFGFSGYSEDLVSTKDVADGQWHLLNVVHDSNDLVIVYVDGVEVANDGLPLSSSLSYTSTVIGADPEGSQNANATIDEVVIFSRAISEEQVLALYENRTDTIVPEETEIAEVWHACVTPNDGTLDGNETCSAEVVLNGISSCTEIPSTGTYTLANNLSGADPVSAVPGISNACIVISYSGTTVNCNGHSISNNGSSDAAGIVVRDDIARLENCASISSYENGVYLNNVEDVVLDNLTTVNSTVSGVHIYDSSLIEIINCTTG
jgi:parallel beta-helix repeat protein